MFWIYIPPIILIGALAALVFILGRKKSDLKRVGAFAARAKTGEEKPLDWKSRLNSLGRTSLHLLEMILNGLKSTFKKTEQVVSGWAVKLRARRSGKKFPAAPGDDILAKIGEEENSLRKTEDENALSADWSRETEGLRRTESLPEMLSRSKQASEMVVRKKIVEEPIIIPKKELLAEDKVKEAALIWRIAENPKDLEAYREIGDYYMGIGNIKDAKEAFKMVLKLRPRDLKAKSSLREIELRMRLGS
jgi:tetratricopeptide (TPR) repeat protein